MLVSSLVCFHLECVIQPPQGDRQDRQCLLAPAEGMLGPGWQVRRAVPTLPAALLLSLRGQSRPFQTRGHTVASSSNRPSQA